MKLQDIRRARERINGQVVETPLAHSETLSRLTGAEIYLKFENHQFTASFKERLMSLSPSFSCTPLVYPSPAM